MFVFESIFGHCMSSTLTATIFLQTPHAVTWLPLSFRSGDLTPAQHDRPVLRYVTGVVHRPPVLRHLFPTAFSRVSLAWTAFHLGHCLSSLCLSQSVKDVLLSFPGSSQVTHTLSRGRAPWIAPECHFGRYIVSAALLLMGLPMNL